MSSEPALGSRLFDVFAVLIISLFLCLYGTGDGSFGSGDQTTHSLVVQNMVNSGDYLHPVYKGRPYYNKPPFKMWLATIPVMLFGESNYSYRVIDGLSGVGIALCVFLFARALFLSRLAGYLSVFALLGARLFFFGHGVRNAVQDSMMLLLMSLGTICGWYFIERVRSEDEENRGRKALLMLAISGGVFIGLAALTKNVAGFLAYVVLGTYLISSGDLIAVVRRSWGYLLLTLAVSLALPAAYIFAQGEHFSTAWQMLLVTEVFKRATKGYHFVHHHWLYFNAIVRDRLMVPPELLAGGIGLALYDWFKRRDRRLLFICCWALAPVVLQNTMKSKLLWYLLPALPGMALLVGVFMTWITRTAIDAYRRWEFSGLPSASSAAAMAVFVYGVGALGYNNGIIAEAVLFGSRRNPPDEIVEDLRAYSQLTGKAPKVLVYNTPILANHEIFYFNMLPQETIAKKHPEALKARLDSGEIQFVVTPLKELEDVAQLKKIESYALIPARNKRRFWLAMLNYVPGYLPKNFIAAEQRFPLSKNQELMNYGFKNPVGLPTGQVVYPSSGPRTSFLLRSRSPYHVFGTDISLNIASVLPAAEGTVDLQVYLNEEKIATIRDVAEGFHERTFFVPPAKWRHKTNLLSFVYELPDGTRVEKERQLVLYESLTIALRQESRGERE